MCWPSTSSSVEAKCSPPNRRIVSDWWRRMRSSWAKMRLAIGRDGRLHRRRPAGARRNVTAAWRRVSYSPTGVNADVVTRWFVPSRYSTWAIDGQDEPVEVGDHPALGGEDAPGQARRAGLAQVLGLDPVVGVAHHHVDVHRVPAAPEQAAVEEGGVGHVEGVLQGGVEAGGHRQAAAHRLVAGLVDAGEAERRRPTARRRGVGKTHTKPSCSAVGKVSTRRARRSRLLQQAGDGPARPAPVEPPPVVAALQQPVLHRCPATGGRCGAGSGRRPPRPTVPVAEQRHRHAQDGAGHGRRRPRSDDRQATYQWCGSRTSTAPHTGRPGPRDVSHRSTPSGHLPRVGRHANGMAHGVCGGNEAISCRRSLSAKRFCWRWWPSPAWPT